MAWNKVTDASAETKELTQTGHYLFDSSATINITDGSYAIKDERADAANTLVLNNDISLSSKNDDDPAYYGIYINTTQAATVRSAERNTKLSVDVNTTVDSLKTYGIHKDGGTKNLLLGKGNEDYRQTINVSASNKAAAEAYGIYSDSNVVFNSKLAAPVTVKTTSETGTADACGVCSTSTSGKVDFNNGITADISVTASGAGANAYGVKSGTGGTTVSAGLAGEVTAIATATGTNDTDNAVAAAFQTTGQFKATKWITKAITAKATSTSGTADAYGINAACTGTSDQVKFIFGLSADISATASGKIANAYAINSSRDVTIADNMAGKITATASAKGGAAKSCAISSVGTIDLVGVDGELSATATGTKADANALTAKDLMINGDIADKIDATATAIGTVNTDDATTNAFALYSNGTVEIKGKITEALDAKTSSKSGEAFSYGIGVSVEGTTITLGQGLNADVSATASGKSAEAGAIYANTGLVINNDIAGKITATAVGTDRAKANALYTEKGVVTVSGNITQAVTAKAASKTGDAEAYGIAAYGSDGSIAIDGDITKTITVSATSKTGVAKAYGVKTVGDLSLVKNLGTVTVTASGAGTDDVATGWDVKNIVASSGELIGKATVTCMTGTATGLIAETIMGPINAAYCTLDITVTGKDAYGIKFMGAATPTIQDSTITTKGSNSAYCLYGDDTRQNLTISNSTLTGDVFMGGMNDNIVLTNKSTLVGDVDMGAEGTDKDTIYIHSGSLLKGDIKNTELLGLNLRDASYADAALWEGDTAEATTSAGGEMTVRLSLNLSLGEDTDHFNLIKHTGATAADWDNFDYQLALDGTGSDFITLKYGEKYTGADSLYDYELKACGESDNTLYLAITDKVPA